MIYLPTAHPPHKPGRALAPALARYAMVELALLGEEGLDVSPHELTLDRPAYTVETLEHFRREIAGAELHLLIGGDSFADLHHWVRFREIARGRAPGGPRPSGLGPRRPPRSTRRCRAGAERPRPAAAAAAGRRLLDPSARAARRRAPAPPGTVPESVVRYLQKYDLYR